MAPASNAAPSSKVALHMMLMPVLSSKAPSSKAASPTPLCELDFDMLDPSALIRDEADHNYLYSLSELDREAIFHQWFEQLKSQQNIEKL